ncbi:hypothetical protein [Kaistella carnis]|nr:hypothetical protein [Kaistella carnis]
MIATSLGGILFAQFSPMSLIHLAIGLSVPGLVISYLSKRSLGSAL